MPGDDLGQRRRSSFATDRSSTFIPALPKLICARALLPPPSILTITPSPNLACATDSPIRHPGPLLAAFCVICCAILLSEPPPKLGSSHADFLLPNQCDCTLGEIHLRASSGSSS